MSELMGNVYLYVIYTECSNTIIAIIGCWYEMKISLYALVEIVTETGIIVFRKQDSTLHNSGATYLLI